ncbi:hopanoid biosynthesis-associated protein HpnK [Flavisphingomonas formosensis]|uniref:hopanoid biosynthesis-associated protein HpnK n=1 Tax=Flavisphingomonas formosensis TaxID=861534 RepID=UPI0012F94E33|nr:hopanoid biosynthesis-associated protein HpnK [Sphingomonas formosensis]
MPDLVVTADDFGVAIEVNEAVELAHRDGILTAASLMVAGEAADDAVARARRLPRLGVGLHLVLVEAKPALPPEEVPDLVGTDGCFRTDMAMLGLQIAINPAVRRQVEREIEAQFAAFAATGLAFDHVNAHKHFHVHPVIAGLVIAAAARYGVRALRAPVEPGRPKGSGWLAAPFARMLRSRARRRGLHAPDQVYGLAASGHMDAGQICAAAAALPEGLSELYLHPATRDDFAGHGPAYRHQQELAGLLDPAARAALARRGVRLGSFTDLV